MGGVSDPHGLTEAVSLTSNQDVDGTAGSYSVVRQTGGVIVTSGQPYTWPIWLQAGTANQVVIYVNDGLDPAGINFLVCNLTSAWRRFVVTQTVRSALAFPSFGWFGDVYDVAGKNVHVWQPDLTLGPYARSAVRTTSAAVTCAQDNLSMADASALPVAAGSVEVVFTPLWSAANIPAAAILFDTRDATPANGCTVFTDGAKLGWIAENAAALESGNLTWNAGQRYHVRVVWGAGNVHIYRDNILVASDLTGLATMPAAQSRVAIGQGYNGTFPLDGNISRLDFFA